MDKSYGSINDLYIKTKKMKEMLKSRVVYYTGFSLLYICFSEVVGFEYAILLCMGTIIGEQARSQRLNQNKDE